MRIATLSSSAHRAGRRGAAHRYIAVGSILSPACAMVPVMSHFHLAAVPAVRARASALVLALLLAACGSPSAEAGQTGAGPTTAPVGATGVAKPLSESDRLTLEMAANACRTGDFKQFFQAFTRSEAVRERYTAKTVEFGTEGSAYQMPVRRYLDDHHYPLGIIDYSWMTRESAMLYEMDDVPPPIEKVRYVQLIFETASDNRQRVEWLPGVFEKNLGRNLEDLGDGTGDLVEPSGPGGYLLFYPTKDCWELVSDVAYRRQPG